MTAASTTLSGAPASASKPGLTLPLCLAVSVVVSALYVIKYKHENRLLTTRIELLRSERRQLDMEWSQLTIEEAALAHHGRIETLARDQLGMSEPRDYVVVGPPPAKPGERK